MIKTYDELKKVLLVKFKFHEITLKVFEERYPHYSLNGDNTPILQYLKGIFVDINGKVNRSNDPFVLLVFAKDNKVLGQRLNGGADIVPSELLDVLNEVEYEEFEEK